MKKYKNILLIALFMLLALTGIKSVDAKEIEAKKIYSKFYQGASTNFRNSDLGHNFKSFSCDSSSLSGSPISYSNNGTKHTITYSNEGTIKNNGTISFKCSGITSSNDNVPNATYKLTVTINYLATGSTEAITEGSIKSTTINSTTGGGTIYIKGFLQSGALDDDQRIGLIADAKTVNSITVTEGNDYISVDSSSCPTTEGSGSSCYFNILTAGKDGKEHKARIVMSYTTSKGAEIKDAVFNVTIEILGFYRIYPGAYKCNINSNDWEHKSATSSASTQGYNYYQALTSTPTFPTCEESTSNGIPIKFNGWVSGTTGNTDKTPQYTGACATLSSSYVAGGATPSSSETPQNYFACYEFPAMVKLSSSFAEFQVESTWYPVTGGYYATGASSNDEITLPDVKDGKENVEYKWYNISTKKYYEIGTKVKLDGSVYVLKRDTTIIETDNYKTIMVGEKKVLSISGYKTKSCKSADTSKLTVNYPSGDCIIIGVEATDGETVDVTLEYEGGSQVYKVVVSESNAGETYDGFVINNFIDATYGTNTNSSSSTSSSDAFGQAGNQCKNYKIRQKFSGEYNEKSGACKSFDEVGFTYNESTGELIENDSYKSVCPPTSAYVGTCADNEDAAKIYTFCIDPAMDAPTTDRDVKYTTQYSISANTGIGKALSYVSINYLSIDEFKAVFTDDSKIKKNEQDVGNKFRRAVQNAVRIMIFAEGWGGRSACEANAVQVDSDDDTNFNITTEDGRKKYANAVARCNQIEQTYNLYKEAGENLKISDKSDTKKAAKAAEDASKVIYDNSSNNCSISTDKVNMSECGMTYDILLAYLTNTEQKVSGSFDRTIDSGYPTITKTENNKGYTISYKGKLKVPTGFELSEVKSCSGNDVVTCNPFVISENYTVDEDSGQYVYDYEVSLTVKDASKLIIPTTLDERLQYSYTLISKAYTVINNIFILGPSDGSDMQRMLAFDLSDTNQAKVYFSPYPSNQCISLDATDYEKYCNPSIQGDNLKKNCPTSGQVDGGFNSDLFRVMECCSMVTDESTYSYLIQNVCSGSCTTSTMSQVCEFDGTSETDLFNTGQTMDYYYIKEGAHYSESDKGYTDAIGTCIVNVSGDYIEGIEGFEKFDDSGNSRNLEEYKDNHYCTVTCKEDWDISVGSFGNYIGVNSVVAGQYFQINKPVYIGASRTCYTTYLNINQYKSDLEGLSNTLQGYMNTYSMNTQLANSLAVKDGTDDATYDWKELGLYCDGTTYISSSENCGYYGSSYSASNGSCVGTDKNGKSDTQSMVYKTTYTCSGSLKYFWNFTVSYSCNYKTYNNGEESNDSSANGEIKAGCSVTGTEWPGTIDSKTYTIYNNSENKNDKDGTKTNFTCNTSGLKEVMKTDSKDEPAAKKVATEFGTLRTTKWGGYTSNAGSALASAQNTYNKMTALTEDFYQCQNFGLYTKTSSVSLVDNSDDKAFDGTGNDTSGTALKNYNGKEVTVATVFDPKVSYTYDEATYMDILQELGDNILVPYYGSKESSEEEAAYEKIYKSWGKTSEDTNDKVSLSLKNVEEDREVVLANSEKESYYYKVSEKWRYGNENDEEMQEAYETYGANIDSGTGKDKDGNVAVGSYTDAASVKSSFTVTICSAFGGSSTGQKYTSATTEDDVNASILGDGSSDASVVFTEAAGGNTVIISEGGPSSSSGSGSGSNGGGSSSCNGRCTWQVDPVDPSGKPCPGDDSCEYYLIVCVPATINYYDANYIKKTVYNSSLFRNKGDWYVNANGVKIHGDTVEGAIANSNSVSKTNYSTTSASANWSKISDYNIFPISFTTPRNLYQYTYTFEDIGMFADYSLGRIMGNVESAVIANNVRSCFYEVIEEICLCCGDDIDSHTTYTNQVDKDTTTTYAINNKINYTTSDNDKVVKNNSGVLGFSNTTVSLNSLTTKDDNGTVRTLGDNWNTSKFTYNGSTYSTSKGKTAKEEIESVGENVYNSTAEYTYVLSPEVITYIKDYNDKNGYEIDFSKLTAYGVTSIAPINCSGSSCSDSSYDASSNNEVVKFSHYGSTFLEDLDDLVGSSITGNNLSQKQGNDNVCVVHSSGDTASNLNTQISSKKCRWIDYVQDNISVTDALTEESSTVGLRLAFK